MERWVPTAHAHTNDRAIGASTNTTYNRWGSPYVSLCLGIWLVISAFIWPHSHPSRTNTWLLGVIIALLSILATRTPSARFANTAAAIWLFVSTLTFMHDSSATVWDNVIVAIAVFVFSLLPNRGPTIRASA